MLKSELVNIQEIKEILENCSPNIKFRVYYEVKDRRGKPVKVPKGKLTLAELAKKIDNLGNDLRNEMNAGFKQVNARLDNVEKRLDNVEARLDYNGLQIEQINKRLDYNGLKKLPEVH